MGKKNPFKILSIKPDFLALSCLISTIVTIILCSRSLRYVLINPNKTITLIYRILDPILIQFLAALIILYFSFKLVKEYGQRYIVFFVSFFIIAFPISHFVTSSFLKPIFNYNRPVSMAEQFIIGTAIELDNKTLKEHSKIISNDIKEFFKSNEAKILFELVNERREKDNLKISKENLENDIKNLDMDNDDKEKIFYFYSACLDIWNKYSPDRILKKYIVCSKTVLINSTEFMKEPWLTYNIKNLLGRKSKNLGEYWHDSCPSDFALRSVMILLLALFLTTQQKDVRNSLFKKRLSLYIFICINIIFFLWVIFSRVYSFRHNFFDIGIGILYGTFFFFLLIIPFLSSNWELNVLFLSFYLIIIILLSIIYGQETKNLLIPAFIALIISSICVSFSKLRRETSNGK